MKVIYAVLLVVLGFFSNTVSARETTFECTVNVDGVKILSGGSKIGDQIVFYSLLPNGGEVTDVYKLSSPNTAVVKGKEPVTNNPFITVRGPSSTGSTKAFIYTDTPDGPTASWEDMDELGNTTRVMACEPGTIKKVSDFDTKGFDSSERLIAKEVKAENPLSSKSFKASSASIYLQNNTYLPAWGVTITSLEDDITITGIALNRGNCTISTSDRGKNMNLKMQYGSTYSFTTPSNNGWTQCQPLELLVKTNRGNVTLEFNY